MKILLDECLPRKFKLEVIGHEVHTVPEMGWAGKKNGELLKLMSEGFDVFLTSDQNLRYQQNQEHLSIAIAVLVAKSNRIDDLKPLASSLLNTLKTIQSGQIVEVT